MARRIPVSPFVFGPWLALALASAAFAQTASPVVRASVIPGAVIAGLRGPVVFIGDKHTQLGVLREELAVAGVLRRGASTDGRQDAWIASPGTTVFLVGDMLDARSTLTGAQYTAHVRMLDFIASLVSQARAKTGDVVWTLGNHDLVYLRATVNGIAVDPMVKAIGERVRMAVVGTATAPGYLRAVGVAGDTLVSHGVIQMRLCERLAFATATPLAQLRIPATFAQRANDAIVYSATHRIYASSIFASDYGVAVRAAGDEARNLGTLPFSKNVVGHDWTYAIMTGAPLFFANTYAGRAAFLLCVDDGTGKLDGTGRETTRIRFLVRAEADGRCQSRTWTASPLP